LKFFFSLEIDNKKIIIIAYKNIKIKKIFFLRFFKNFFLKSLNKINLNVFLYSKFTHLKIKLSVMKFYPKINNINLIILFIFEKIISHFLDF